MKRSDTQDTPNRISLKERIHLTLRGYKTFGKENPRLFPSVFLYAILSGVSPYVIIYLTAQMLSALSSGASAAVIWKKVILLVTGTAITGILSSIAKHYKEYRQGNSYWTYRGLIGKKLLSLDFPALNDAKTQNLKRKIENDSNRYGYGLREMRDYLEKLLQGVTGIISSVALTVSFFTFHVDQSSSLAWLDQSWVVILMILLILLTAFASAKFAHEPEKFTEEHSAVSVSNDVKADIWYICTQLSENNIPVDVRINRMYPYLDHVFDDYYQDIATNVIARHEKGKGGVFAGLSAVVSALFMGLVYVLVCLKAYGGAYDIGYVSQYVGALTALTGGLTMAAEALGTLYTNAAYLKNTFDYLDISNELYQGSLTTEKRSDHEYEIEFRDVSFRYPNTEAWVLRHVSVKFKIGQKMAVVGRNGSGKTTFIKLLCRLYDPDEGQILLNGIDIRKYNYDDYQRLFSVVFQDYHLMNVSIAENVAASAKYDEEKVMDCLEKAGFAERLSAMKKGIHTYLGKTFDEEGIELSGGESQKLAIARSLYQPSDLLILDEPTAALDPKAEAEIYERLSLIVEDRTAIYISHRLSTCKFCDEIMVFDHGSVVQKGNHQQLLEEDDSVYARLWNAQAKYYQKETTDMV